MEEFMIIIEYFLKTNITKLLSEFHSQIAEYLEYSKRYRICKCEANLSLTNLNKSDIHVTICFHPGEI